MYIQTTIGNLRDSNTSQPQGDSFLTCYSKSLYQLGFKSLDDWYHVTVEDIVSNGGQALLKPYNMSPFRALQNIYRQHNWDIHKFKQKPKMIRQRLQRKEFYDWLGNKPGYEATSRAYLKKVATDSTEARDPVEWLGDRLSIKSLDDRYRVPLSYIRNNWIQIESSKDLGNILPKVYPQHPWNKTFFGRLGNSKAPQAVLFRAVQQLFPNHSMIPFFDLYSEFQCLLGWRKT